MFSQTEIKQWLAATEGKSQEPKATHVMFSVEMMLSEIGGCLNHREAERLKDNYPTYEWAWRVGFLQALEHGIPHTVAGKLEAIKADPATASAQKLKAEQKWIYGKYFKAAVRVLFLRYVWDKRLTPAEANRKLFEHFDARYNLSSTVKNPKDAPRTIRNYTRKGWRYNPRGFKPPTPRH